MSRTGEHAVAVIGSTGRLGSAIMRACADRSVPVTSTASSQGWQIGSGAPTVVIDASGPSACAATIDYCAETGAALLYCVSDPSAEQVERLRSLSDRVPVARASNLSPLHWIQARALQLSGRLAATLLPVVQVTVIERHPPTKKDAPSATARVLAAIPEQQTAIVSERFGPPVSDHRVLFTQGSETLEFAHSVRDLSLPAVGALVLATELAKSASGWFSTDELYERISTVAAIV
ncbi:dihydrodipicolinate reductase C-terminal domain-containing protein [Nocardia salmonicida]|uniref:dihydrodipicolinate reductase C-terminal domain-containing protein n=1 Tax=Nocardia salmonicida TaxID=53431 RepID=UPI0036654F00